MTLDFIKQFEGSTTADVINDINEYIREYPSRELEIISFQHNFVAGGTIMGATEPRFYFWVVFRETLRPKNDD